MDTFEAKLRGRGFRATPGRVALLRTVANSKRSLTVEDIAQKLDLNMVTLYRALNDLAEAGLLLRGAGIGHAMRFSYPRNHHHHMICADCGFTSKCAVC